MAQGLLQQTLVLVLVPVLVLALVLVLVLVLVDWVPRLVLELVVLLRWCVDGQRYAVALWCRSWLPVVLAVAAL